MADTEEPTAPTTKPASNWLEQLAEKEKLVLTIQWGAAAVMAVVIVWLAIQYGENAWLPITLAVWMLGVLSIAGGVHPWFQGNVLDPVKRVRFHLMAVGALIGFACTVYAVSQGYVWWDDIRSWVGDEPGKSAWKPLVVIVVMVAGLILMFVSLQLGRTEERSSPLMRRLLYGYNAVLTGLLLLAILTVGNVLLTVRAQTPLDFTGATNFTLSPQSQNILKGLDKPVKITFIRGFRYPFIETEMLTLLNNCRDLSKNVQVEELSVLQDRQKFIDLAKKYAGLDRGTLLVVYGNEDSNQWRVIQEKDMVAEPDRMDPNPTSHHKFTGEDALMSAISFLAVDQKKSVLYFTQGHNELDLNDAAVAGKDKGAGVLKRRLEKRNFDVKPLQFDPVNPKVPPDASVVLVAGPRQPFAPAEAKALGDYMNRKGRLIVMLQPVIGADKKMVPTGLEEFLAGFSVQTPPERILSLPVNFPLEATDVVGVMNPKLEQNPLVGAFEDTRFRFSDTRPIRGAPANPAGMSRYDAQPLILVGSFSWAESDLAADPSKLLDDVMRNQQALSAKVQAIRAAGPQPIAVAVTESNFNPMNPHGGGGESKPRMLVFGNATMASNRNMAEQSGQLYFDLLSSGIDWLQEQNNKMGIAPKNHSAFVLEPKSKFEKFRMVVLPLLLVFAGLFGLATGVWIVRRR